jgi:membrane dipeptidase
VASAADFSLAGPAPPRERLDPAYAKETADALAAILFKIEAGSRGQMKIVRAAVLHLEGAENLGPDPGTLEDHYEADVRSLGLVWSPPNAYGYGIPVRFPASLDTGPGLTGAGRELMCERGYDEAALKKLAHENWIRVLRATWGG